MMERDPVLDYAKGIVIILMVIGHCYSTENTVLTLVYGFHMAFFFVISGIIYGRKSTRDDFQYSPINTVKKLLLPYFSYELIFSAFLSVLDQNQPFYQSLAGKIISIISFKGVTATWYLACIVFVELVFLYFYKKWNTAVIPTAFALFLFGIFVAPYAKSYVLVPVRCMIGMGFFAFGFLIGRKGLRANCLRFQNLLLSVCAIAYVICSLANGMVSLVILKLSNPILYTLNALLGTITVLMFSDLLLKKPIGILLEPLLNRMGRNTLFILGTHMLLIEAARLLDHKLAGSIFPKLGLAEGIVLGLMICIIEYAAIKPYYKIKKYLHQRNKEHIHCAKD